MSTNVMKFKYRTCCKLIVKYQRKKKPDLKIISICLSFCYENLVGNLKEICHVEDMVIDGKIMLKLILKKRIRILGLH
jgi:hypothetical protein